MRSPAEVDEGGFGYRGGTVADNEWGDYDVEGYARYDIQGDGQVLNIRRQSVAVQVEELELGDLSADRRRDSAGE